MQAIRRILMVAAFIGGLGGVTAPRSADAGVIYRRVAPVRRVAARAALPPYPVARRAVVGPVYRPYYRPYYGGYRGAYGPGFYGPGISIGIY